MRQEADALFGLTLVDALDGFSPDGLSRSDQPAPMTAQ
jgi:hypothetical protein